MDDISSINIDNNTEHIEEPQDGKMDSFFGDRSIVMPKKQQKKLKMNALIGDLYLTDIGFYPNAKNHYQNRKKILDENILIYCVDGSGTIQLGEDRFRLSPSSYFIIPARVKHKYWSSSSTPWSIYWLHFGGDRSKYFENFYGRIIPIKKSTKSRVNDRIDLFNEILAALEAGFSDENVIFANLCLNSLLASFFYVETYRAVKGHKAKSPVDEAIFFMQSKINENLKIDDIASHVKLSASHLTKLFKGKTGTSPLDYFINLKMQEAARLITNQSLRIKEVAFKLGYNDPYYFTRIFTKHFGSSPVSFLKMSKP